MNSDLVVDPCGVQRPVPIWIGGRTARSLRRAVELGDAWAPFALGPDEVAALLDRARRGAEWAARATPLEVVLQPVPALDPLGAPDPTRAALAAHQAAGATAVGRVDRPAVTSWDQSSGKWCGPRGVRRGSRRGGRS